MSKSGLFRGTLAATVALAFAGIASAQYTQNDAANCGPQTNDPNGGCNLASPLFQDLGSHATGEFLTVTGTIGTYIPTGGTMEAVV